MSRRKVVCTYKGVELERIDCEILVLLDDVLRQRRHEVLELPGPSCRAYRELASAGLVVLGTHNGGGTIVATTDAGGHLATTLRASVVGT